MSTLDERIEQDDIKLRAKYLREVLCYTSDEIRGFASNDASGKLDCVSMWTKQNKIFSVNNDGVEVFPSFQFSDGKPLKIIESLLSQMPDDMSSWEIAFWFASANGYISNDQAPQSCLELNDDLVAAVKALTIEIYW